MTRPSKWKTVRTQLIERLPKDDSGNDFDYTADPVEGGVHVQVRDRGPDGIPFNDDDEVRDCGPFPAK